MAAFLVPLEPGACVIPLEKAILLIGRQADCDVSLTASRKISRKHCCIAIVNDNVVVRDLGSTNGVSINGMRIEQEGRLRLGDELSIGDVRFRLQKDARLPERLQQEPGADFMQRPDPRNQDAPSMDFPVAITDGNAGFVQEPTFPRIRPISNANATESDDLGPLMPFEPLDDRGVRPMRPDSI